MTATKLRFTEFVELLLARLYDLERTHGPQFYSLSDIAKEMKESVPLEWVMDAGKVLERHGLAQCVFAFGGIAEAQLTGEGRMFVEREEGTGIIKEYHRAPANYVVVSGDGNQVIVGGSQQHVTQEMALEREREPAFQLLREIESGLKKDLLLTDAERKDLLEDVDVIRRQLRKREPNRSALAALLEPLAHVSSIAGFVANLIKLFNQ